MQRQVGPCPTCRTSLKKGWLWLGGNDYVECPDCDGTGTFVCYAHHITPGRSILMPGRRDLPAVAVAAKVSE